MARRKGDIWYLGTLTNWEKRTMEIDLSFLGDGEWSAELYKDGVNAGTVASDYTKSIIAIPQDRKLSVTMAEGGGCALKSIKSEYEYACTDKDFKMVDMGTCMHL